MMSGMQKCWNSMVRATIDGDVDLNLIAGEIMEKGEGEDEKE